jgi:hypothetical protein
VRQNAYGPDLHQDIISVSLPSTAPTDASLASLALRDPGQIAVYTRTTLNNQQPVVSRPVLSLNTWYHIAGVVDYANESVSIFVNGEPVIDTIIHFGYTATPSQPSRSSVIGAADMVSWEFLNGSLDEVRVERRARSADWIKLCYQNQRTGSTFVRAVTGSRAP